MACKTERNLVLAELPPLGSVSMCSCGTIHLAVGAATLRLAPEAFGQLIRMCQGAADRMLLEAAMQPDTVAARFPN